MIRSVSIVVEETGTTLLNVFLEQQESVSVVAFQTKQSSISSAKGQLSTRFGWKIILRPIIIQKLVASILKRCWMILSIFKSLVFRKQLNLPCLNCKASVLFLVHAGSACGQVRSSNVLQTRTAMVRLAVLYAAK